MRWLLGLGLGLAGCTGSGDGGTTSPDPTASPTGGGPVEAPPEAPGSSSAPDASSAPNDTSPPGGAAPAADPSEPSAPTTSPTQQAGLGAGGGSEDAGSSAGGASGGANAAAVGGSGGTDENGSGGADAGVTIVGDDFVMDVDIAVHPEVSTLLVVTWTQTAAADEVWLEFDFESGNTMSSRPLSGEPGEHRDVVIGVPGETEVTVRIVSKVGDAEYRTSDYEGTTDAVPSGMPVPEVLLFDEALASSDRWMLGAVEDSDGGCASDNCYYHTTFWLYIIDRMGRIVWYYADPASNATSSFQRIARDGEYIWIEKRPFSGFSERGVLKMTLDWEYFEYIDVPDLADCIDVTDDGSLLYDNADTSELEEMNRDGEVRSIWSCSDEFGGGFECYSNTINWNPADDTVLMSFPYERTVVQIDRQSGAVVGQYGEAAGSYAFSPDSWTFGFQHFPNITQDGTLLVSTHMPGFADTFEPVAGEHAFAEFEIDRESQTLTEKWFYNEGGEWPMFKGMAIRLPNGNTLANYGTGGVIREITPEKETAFHVKFDVEEGDDFFNKMVGHNVLIDDLYALNGGPQ
jgi:hypothetical protein